MTDPWERYSYEFDLTEVRVVAAVLDGGAITESVPALRFNEGRSGSAHPVGDGYEHRLEYSLAFSIPGDPVPETGEAMDARIIIDGTAKHGEHMEIRGEGWIGCDDQGRVEGHLDEAPVILIGDGSWGEIEPGQPRVPEQYMRASRMRPRGDEFRIAAPASDPREYN